MSTLADRPVTSPKATAADLLPLFTAAVRAVLTLLVPVVVLSLVTWIAAVRSTSSLAAVVRVGTDVWLLGHGADVAVVGGRVGLAPLGVTLLALLSARRAVRMWVHDQEEAERAVPFGPALAVFAGAYGVLTAFVALVTRSGVSAPSLPGALVGGLLLGVLGAVAGTWRHRPALPAALPAPVAAALRPAAGALAALVGLGSLAVAAALVHGRADVALLHEALDPGVLGGALLTAAQLLLLPTLAVWGLAWIAGPGFAVGVGTSVAPGGTTLATLPTVPVLGALPAEGPTSGWALAALALPVLVGAGASVLESRRGPGRGAGPAEGLLRRCATALLTGVLTGLPVAVLALAAGGPAGAGRMSDLGPDAGLLGLVVAGEVAAGGLVAVLLSRAWTAWRGTEVVIVLPDAGRGTGLLGRGGARED